MKRLLILAILFFFAKLNSQNSFTSLDSALVACYPFTGNANDLSGNGLNGTVNGATLVADRFNNPNSAYSFGGSTATSNIVVPGFNSQLNGTAISICFWTAKTVAAYDAAFLIVPDYTSNRLAIAPYYLYYNGTEAIWDYGDIYGNGRLGVATSTLPVGWDHWVFVSNYSSSTMKMYKNGVLFGSKSSSENFSTSGIRDLCIGGGIGNSYGALWYNGKIDDIRIYKRELLAAEVAYIYNNNVSCSSCPAVLTPSTSISASASCIGNSVTLSASGSPTLQWYASASSTLSLGSGTTYVPSSYTASGTYTYYIRAGNGCNTSSPLTITYTVNPLPSLQIVANKSFVCAGQSAVLLATGATNYTWQPGNVQTQSLSITPGSTSTYTLKGESFGCASTTTLVMPVVNLPSVSIVASNSIACLGKTLTLNAAGATNYTWQPGNFNTPSINISPLATTVYSLSGETSGCTTTTVISIPVANVPSVSIAGSTLLCVGNTALLLASGAVNYTWMPGNLNSQILTISPSSTTSYSVTGEANGCSNTAVISVSVAMLPTVTITSSDFSVCPGSPVSYTAGGAATYSWNTGNTTPVITFFPTSSNSFTVTGFDVNNCSNTSVASVFVQSVSPVQIASSNTLICFGETVNLSATGATSYTWSTGAQSDSVTLTPSVTSTYTVTGTDPGNGCPSSATYVQTVDACTGISSQGRLDETFALYPNPTSGRFMVLTGKPCQVLIRNSLGEVVYAKLHSDTSEINLENFANGVYILTLQADGLNVSRKLIKH